MPLGPSTTQNASDISHHVSGSAFWPRATRSPVNNGNEICLLSSSPPRKQITHNNIIFPYTHLDGNGLSFYDTRTVSGSE